jgi:hypothetical protein
VLRAAAKRAGASFGLFLIGERREEPVGYPGTFGELWLERSTLRIVARPCDADGRADVELPLTGVGAGLEVHVQAAFRVGGALHFGETVVDALVL